MLEAEFCLISYGLPENLKGMPVVVPDSSRALHIHASLASVARSKSAYTRTCYCLQAAGSKVGILELNFCVAQPQDACGQAKKVLMNAAGFLRPATAMCSKHGLTD